MGDLHHERPANKSTALWNLVKSVSITLLFLYYEELRHFLRQKSVQPSIRKVYLIKWLLRVFVCKHAEKEPDRSPDMWDVHLLACMFERGSMMWDRSVEVTARPHGQIGTRGSGMLLASRDPGKNCGHLQSHLRHLSPYHCNLIPVNRENKGKIQNIETGKHLKIPDHWNKQLFNGWCLTLQQPEFYSHSLSYKTS